MNYIISTVLLVYHLNSDQVMIKVILDICPTNTNNSIEFSIRGENRMTLMTNKSVKRFSRLYV